MYQLVKFSLVCINILQFLMFKKYLKIIVSISKLSLMRINILLYEI